MTKIDALMLARHMFEFEARDFDASEEEVERAWNDEQTRFFWVQRAESVLSFLNFARVER